MGEPGGVVHVCRQACSPLHVFFTHVLVFHCPGVVCPMLALPFPYVVTSVSVQLTCLCSPPLSLFSN